MNDVARDVHWEEDKTVFRTHVDALLQAHWNLGQHLSRPQVIRNLRDKSLRRVREELGSDISPQQEVRIARYQAIMEELIRECDN